MMRRLQYIVLTLALLIPSAACADWLRGIGGLVQGAQAATMSESDLVEYVAEQVKEMDRKNTVAGPTNKYGRRLANLCKGLENADGLKLNFKVYITAECNAFACPDGSVRVYSGLMDLLDDNELLGVIGHEIGHVAMKHSYKAWKDALYRSAVDDVLCGVSDTYATISDSALGVIAGTAISAKHSKKHENEADDYGYRFLKSHNRNPWAMAMAFEKLKKMQGDSRYAKVRKYLNVFSSHPDFDTRISRMSSKAKADGYKRPAPSH